MNSQNHKYALVIVYNPVTLLRGLNAASSVYYSDQRSILGQGQFGIIYNGQCERNGEITSVAFKTSKDSENVQSVKSLLAEIKLLIYIGSHPNIIELIGAYTEQIQDGTVLLSYILISCR